MTDARRYAESLRTVRMVAATDCARIPDRRGIYLFLTGDRVMYVGKAATLRERIKHQTHHAHRGYHRTTSLLASTLANNMAEASTGLTPNAANRNWRTTVLKQAERVRRMSVRCVTIPDKDVAAGAEREAIKMYKPEFNRR